MKNKLIQINNNLVEGLGVICFIWAFAEVAKRYCGTYWLGVFVACFMLGIYFNSKK